MVQRVRQEPEEAGAAAAEAIAPAQAPEGYLSRPLAAVSDFIYAKGDYSTVLAALTSASLLGYQISTRIEALKETTELPLLAGRPSYTPAQAYDLLQALGPEGRSEYQYINILSTLAYPFLVSAFLSLAIGGVMHRAGWGHEWNLFPFVFFAASLAENAGVGFLLHSYPDVHASAAAFTGMVTSMKHRFWWYNILILGVGCALLLRSEGQKWLAKKRR